MSRLTRLRFAGQIAATLLAAVLSPNPSAFAQPAGHTPSSAGAPQTPMQAMPGRSATMGQSPAADGGTAGNGGLMQAMDRMNQAMVAASATGDVDHDFAAMMIPHHQGAIDMAKVELAGGKDPFLRKLAQNIIASQQREIREMRAWLGKHPAN